MVITPLGIITSAEKRLSVQAVVFNASKSNSDLTPASGSQVQMSRVASGSRKKNLICPSTLMGAQVTM